jgi:hypothetical protein
MDSEICTRCHRPIPSAEQLVVLDGRVVCAHCALQYQPVEVKRKYIPPPSESVFARNNRRKAQARPSRGGNSRSLLFRRLLIFAVALIVIVIIKSIFDKPIKRLADNPPPIATPVQNPTFSPVTGPVKIHRNMPVKPMPPFHAGQN